MSSLDHHLLRASHQEIAGPYLHKIATNKQISTHAISVELLYAVAKQSLPPRVYELWLCACPDETAIVLGLQQSHCILVRRGAIKAFRRWFRTCKCIDIWRAVGGAEGIVNLLAIFSVEHVREFCKAIGRCSTSTALRLERQELVTELMYSLASRFFPQSAKVSNLDERPLWNAYGGLVYACTPEARDAWIDHKTLPELNMTKVMETDTEHFQQKCLIKTAAGDKDLEKFYPLLVSLPEKRSEVDVTVPQSMEFAALFLETLAEHDIELVRRGGERKLPSALRMIVTRLARRQISADFALEMIGLISTRTKDLFVAEATAYTSDYDDYLTDVARLWMRNPDAYEAPLSQLLKMSDMIQMPQLSTVVSIVPRKDRYRLLRWLVLTQHNVDIEDAKQLTRFRVFTWMLLASLPKPEARALVDRIVSIKGEKEKWLHPILSDAQMPDTGVQLDILRCRLAEDNSERNEEAKLKIAQYQRLAEKDREAQGRLEWVTAAGYMAVVAGSLDLLKEVLLWARRFNKDHVVTQGFYERWTFLRKTETLDLLSGIPEKPTPSTKKTAVESNIRKGNDIALLLLETAAMCQNEPSFYATHWSELQHLLADIVKVRIERIRRLRHQVGMLHDDKIDFVWQPTLDALLDAERLGLDERNQALQLNDMNGPLDLWRDVEIEDPDISVLWFINELARRRDALWQKHRCSIRPNVMTLEPPWPRGLPVQALLSVHINGMVLQGDLQRNIPFVLERARSVVFMPKNVAFRDVPEDEEQRAAIGCFMEDYSIALKIHIMGCNKVERRERGEAAWTHATTELSEPRLSPREAVMYWQRIFKEADAPIPKRTLDLRPAPILPQVDVYDDKPEWQPDVGPHSSIRTLKLNPVSLDCSTSPPYGKKTLHDAFVEPRRPSINRNIVPDFWNFDRYASGIPFDRKDAYIAAGLMLIDSISQAGAKLLSEPFPDRADIRFPAVYLDSDFVEDQQTFETFPLVLLNDTPPALLDQLTTALIAKLCESAKPTPALVRWTFTTLKLLAWSDNPELAIRHIIHVIIDLPDHSSWHRVMLHPGVLRRLSAQQSRSLVAGLANAINEKSRQRKADQATSDSAPLKSEGDAQFTPKPYVKVTTVKLLAQLMRHAEFIGESFTVEILVKLFTESTHVDIRAAVVDSLVAIAISTKITSIEEEVISMLETHAIPLAAELSERSPMTEQSWAECEEKCEPPAVENGRPTREAVLGFLRQIGYQKNPVKMRGMVRRILLPLIQKAAANAQRWLKILLRANDATHLYAHIPVAFGAIDLFELLLDTYTDHMPAASYAEFHNLMVFFARASNTYQELSRIFNAMDPPPHAHDAQQRLFDWASDENCDPDDLEYDPNVPALFMHNTFATAEDAATHDLLTPAQLQAHEREMFDIRLERLGQEPGRWSSLVNTYEPPLRRREDVQLAWYTYCRPIVEYMVERIETMRTPAWQQDPHRQPARLPDAFPLRLWLLPYPSRPWRADAEQEQRKWKFGNEVLQLLKELAESGRPYHKHFALIVAAANKCYEKDRAAIALHLGSLGEWEEGRELTLHELLRIELADILLQGAKQPVAEQVMEGVKLMLQDWSCCVDEGARDRAIVSTALLRKNARNGVKDALPWFPWEA